MQNKYLATCFICAIFVQKKRIYDIDNQKVQVDDEMKHDIWKHLMWQMMLDIIMCITFRPVQINTELLVPFDYNLPFNFKIVAYKTSSWVFILLTSVKKKGK